MKIGHYIWAKYREAREVIGLDGLFNDYWSSNAHEFTVLGQSLLPTGPRRSDGGEQRPLSLENIVGIYDYDSFQMIPFVPVPPPSPPAYYFAQVEALRLSLHELEGLLDKYSPMMSESTEKAVDRAIKYGAVFAEVSSLPCA